MNLGDEICNAFNAHAKNYEQAATVQHEIGSRLFERLDYLKINPRYVLDLGCGPGIFLKKLKKYYPKAIVIGLDVAFQMLHRVKVSERWRQKSVLVNGDMMQLPFASGVFDLVFANQVIHWSLPFNTVIRELNRILNPGGCLMFSTLGPDTFKELRLTFQTLDSHAHVNDFLDMHDIGDCLLHETFQDPVVDMELLTAHFKSVRDLLYGLKTQGVRNINSTRNPGLTGKLFWSKFNQEILRFKTSNGKFPLTYEVIYGHAWKGAKQRTAAGVETVISLDTFMSGLKR